MTASAVDAVLDVEVQKMIQALIVKHSLIAGIGPHSREDVEQHLCRVAIETLRNYTGPAIRKPASWLFTRLDGACRDWRRVYSAKTRQGHERPVFLSLDNDTSSNPPQRGANAHKQHGIVRRSLVRLPVHTPDIAEAFDLAHDLSMAIATMPPRMRIVVYLLFYEHLSERDAAERMGLGLEGLRALRDAAMTKCRLAILGSS